MEVLELKSRNPKGLNHPKVGLVFQIDPTGNPVPKKGDVVKIDGVYRTAHKVEKIHDFGGHPWVNIAVTYKPELPVRENIQP